MSDVRSTASPTDPRTGSLLAIFLIVFIDLLGFGMVLPLLPIYAKSIAAGHHLTNEQVGWVVGILMASFSAMQFLFLPIWGRLSDRVGRRPILLVGLAGSTFFYAMFGVATMHRSLIGLFVTRIGAGIAGATISTAQAYIADTTTMENRAKGMALIGAAFALGFTLGPLIGMAALAGGGEAAVSPWPGFVAASLSAVALALAVFQLPESLNPASRSAAGSLFDRSALRAALTTPSIGLLLGTSFIAIFSFANFESTLSLQIQRIVESDHPEELNDAFLQWLVQRIHGWGYESTSDVTPVVVLLAFSYLGIVLTLAQGVLVRRLASRISEGTMAMGGGALALVGFVLLAGAVVNSSFALFMAAMSVEVVGFAFVNPSLQSLISRRSDPNLQGGILGLGQSATSLARILGPVCGVRLFAQAPAWPYLAATILMGLGLLMTIAAARGGHDFVATSDNAVRSGESRR